jgi:dihydroflavonol-4-reductase
MWLARQSARPHLWAYGAERGRGFTAVSKVLVTGGSGFIGSHAILQLLAAGHDVRATVRNLSRVKDVQAMLRHGGSGGGETGVDFVAADLEDDGGWAAAAAGCDYVLHVASPFPEKVPKHEDDLIRPAREGALRVLRAARDAKVKRVVLTSSFAAIGYGSEAKAKTFTEADWTNPDSADVQPYAKSKTLAERAAWDFIKAEGGGLELSVVNPVGVFGPVLGPDYSSSILIVQRLMDGALPGCPRLYFGAVDVRDVADLHIRAMTAPEARGERFLAVAGDFLSFKDIALILRAGFPKAAAKVPTRELPDFMVRLVALMDPAARQILPELGKHKNAVADKARRVLGWAPRSNQDAILATAQSLLDLKLLKA